MSAVVAQTRRAIGEEGANVTLARNLLAPVASQLSGGGGGGGCLHRRCVLFDCAPLRGPAGGSCHAVPPLELGTEMPVIRPTDVKIMSDSRVPATGSSEPVACMPQPPPEAAAWIEFRDLSVSGEANGGPFLISPRGTKRFRDMIADDDQRGMRMEHGDSIRGVRRTDPPPPEKRRAGVLDTTICFESF